MFFDNDGQRNGEAVEEKRKCFLSPRGAKVHKLTLAASARLHNENM